MPDQEKEKKLKNFAPKIWLDRNNNAKMYENGLNFEIGKRIVFVRAIRDRWHSVLKRGDETF